MRDSTKRRLEKLEATRAPVELREVVIVGVACRRDPDGTIWSRNASRYYPRTRITEKLDEPWEVVRRGAP
jgi:hypothetical protein